MVVIQMALSVALLSGALGLAQGWIAQVTVRVPIPEDHILMASDYPHFDSEYPHTVETIRARKDLDERQKTKILGGNAASPLGF